MNELCLKRNVGSLPLIVSPIIDDDDSDDTYFRHENTKKNKFSFGILLAYS